MTKRIVTIFLAIVLAAFFVAETGCSFGSKKGVKYSKRRGHSGGTPQFSWPLDNGTYMSGFGIRRGRRHDGIDIAAKGGTPVKAAASGEVVFSKRMRGYGRLVLVKHGNNYFTAYAHNRRNLVNKGDKVKRGQKIALVGRSGRATGNHVHFEIRKGQSAIDPLLYLPARAGVIAKRKPLPPPAKTTVAARSRQKSTKVAKKQSTKKTAAPAKTVQLAAHDPTDSKEIANLIENEIPDVLPEQYEQRMQKRTLVVKRKKKK